MNGPVINLDQLEFTRDLSHGDKFEARIAPIGTKLGALKLGYNVTAVPPGKRAFPYGRMITPISWKSSNGNYPKDRIDLPIYRFAPAGWLSFRVC